MEFYKWLESNPGKSWADYTNSGGMNTGMSMGVTPNITPEMVTAGNIVPKVDAGTGWDWNSGDFANTMSGVSNIVGSLGGIYGMMQSRDMMKLAKQDQNMRAQSYKDNKNRRDNFESKTNSSFGA